MSRTGTASAAGACANTGDATPRERNTAREATAHAAMPALRNTANLFCVPLYAAKCRAEQGDIEAAKALYKEVFDIYYKHKKGINNYSLRAVIDLAKLHEEQKEYAQAEHLLTTNIDEAKKDLLRTVFLNMHHNQDMRNVLRELMFERFIIPQNHLYDYPRRILSEVKASP